MGLIEKAGWMIGGAVGIALLMTTRGFIPVSMRLPLFFVGVAAAAAVVPGWVTSAIVSRRRA